MIRGEKKNMIKKGRRNFLIFIGYFIVLFLIWFVVNNYFMELAAYPDLVNEYKDTLKDHPDNAEIHYKLGELYFEMNEQMPGKGYLSRAKSQYEKAVELIPQNIDYRYSLAEIMKSIDKKKALKEYDAILEIDSYEVQANYEKALYETSNGNFDSAVVYFEKCLVREPTSSNVYFELGEIFEAQKKQEEAIKMYELAKKFNPAMEGIDKKLTELSMGN
jgi:tetratricopeptide (TPR) repeat protein